MNQTTQPSQPSRAKSAAPTAGSRWSRWVRRLLIGGVVLLALIQLFPVSRWQTNPTARAEPAWNAPQTRSLATRACFDCHSNETTWPWYSSVAPASWLVTRHVVEGRQRMNLSEWQSPEWQATLQPDRRQRLIDDVAKVIQEGEMPPSDYLLLHPEARLSADEQKQLADGLTASLKAAP